MILNSNYGLQEVIHVLENPSSFTFQKFRRIYWRIPTLQYYLRFVSVKKHSTVVTAILHHLILHRHR